ncbi:MAG TPA: hypothetical protein VHQ24_03315 [Lachnospiraceae bacterium]|nr:hypothetical protein [Lachnospiraceae bacterium]
MIMKRIPERLSIVPVRRKAKQLLAVTLSFILVNPFTGYGAFVHAKEVETITAFTELSDEIANQQLAVGAEESDIQLPNTLNVIVEAASVDQAGSDAQTTTGAAIDVNTVQDLTEMTQSATLKYITWEMDGNNSTSDTFDSSVDGAFYTYVPVLPEGYTLETNVSLPEISVQIGSGMMQLMTSQSSISISGVPVDSTDWYATTDTNGTVNTTGASADNWNIHVVISDTTATVTLKNATIKNPSSDASAIKVNGYDLNIVLEGTVNQIGTDASSEGYAIYKSTSGNVTITGNGDLTLKGNYGIYVNGLGDVNINITGSLSIESLWQMISTAGALKVEAKSIDMDGNFVYGGSVSFTATDGDVVVTGDGNYGIQSGNITVSAPQGTVTISGNYNSLYGGSNTTISISAKNDVTLKGIVYSGSVSISSENGDINLNSDYQAIQGASKNVALSAPQGDITLRSTSEYVNMLSGSGYALTIIAGGTLDIQSGNGIADYSMADIKAQSVKIAATSAGYGLCGGSISIANPEGGNCSKVYLYGGGGGGRDAIHATDLTIKADQVTIAAPADAENAVNITGNATIGNTGIIVGNISVKGTNSISPAIMQVSSNGGDVSTSGLDLKNSTPTQTTYYKAGEGYIIYTPAQGDKPAALSLMDATIETDAEEALILPDAAVKMELSGRNKLRSSANYGSGIQGNNFLTITSLDGGTLDMESIHYAMNFEKADGSTITIGGNASVTAVSYNNIALITGGNLIVEAGAKLSAKGKGIDVMVNGNFHVPDFNGSVMVVNDAANPITYDITIYGTCDMPALLAATVIGTTPNGVFSLHIPSGSQLTIPTKLPLVITDMSKLKLEGKIVNNGIIYLPVGTTADQIKAMNLTGTGGVFLTKSIDGNGMPSKDNGDAYTNDGKLLNLIGDDLSLDTTKEIAASENKGYTWTKSGEGESEAWTLNLSDTLVRGNVSLPDSKAITIHCTEDTVIDGGIYAGQSYKCNLTFTGTGKLNIGNGISNGIGGTVTVKDGAEIITGRLSFGGSGNSDSVLNISGKDSSLTATSNQGSAVSVETVNVTEGGKLIMNAETIGVMAGKGGVTITGGSTLTAGCDYGVYIIDGKLTMDESSKLITNGSIAPFCIVDTTSTKEESAVLSLAGVPTGTEIASVKGTDTGYGYTYWSLVKEGGNLQALNENSEPITLTGAVQGEKLDFSKPTPPPAPTYAVNVQTDGNGTASASVTSAKQGTEITLTATPNSNYKFKGWQVISGEVTVIENKFIMPGKDVTIKATFEPVSTDNNGGSNGGNNDGNNDGNNGSNSNGGSGGSSGNSSSDDNSGSTATPEKNSDQPVIGSVNAVGTVTDGHAVVRITDSMVKAGIEKAQSDAKAQGKTANGIGVEVSVTAPGAKSFTVITERAALNRLVSTNVKLMQVKGLPIHYSFDQTALKGQGKKGTGDVTIKVKPATVKGVRSAYDITLSTTKNGKTVKITSLGKGKATLSLPYAPAKKEAIDGLYAVYVNAKGKIIHIIGSSYDTKSKSVIFTTNHFSVYGVGYTAPAAK